MASFTTQFPKNCLLLEYKNSISNNLKPTCKFPWNLHVGGALTDVLIRI